MNFRAFYCLVALALGLAALTSRAAAPGLVQVVEFCSDPSATGPADWTPSTGPETIAPINAQWERVTVDDITGEGQARRFGRVRFEVTR
ncbi:MAG: hypothetical protein ACKO2G_14770 [Verrucomicrobiales bacterium]